MVTVWEGRQREWLERYSGCPSKQEMKVAWIRQRWWWRWGMVGSEIYFIEMYSTSVIVHLDIRWDGKSGIWETRRFWPEELNAQLCHLLRWEPWEGSGLALDGLMQDEDTHASSPFPLPSRGQRLDPAGEAGCDHTGKLCSGVKISGSPFMTSSHVLSSGSALSLKKIANRVTSAFPKVRS